jgi:hypothetical protein
MFAKALANRDYVYLSDHADQINCRGKGDIAMENAIALEGFRDYFACPNSQLIQISRCGHWSPVEKNAMPIFDEVLEWSVTGERGSLKERLGDNFPLAQILTER